MYVDNGVIDTTGKATELPWANENALSLYLDDDRTAQHNEALVTLFMSVRMRILPSVMRVVVPDL